MVFIKTLIELFDENQLNNVISALHFLPEKIVYIGFKKVMNSKKTGDLTRFFQMRGMDVTVEYEIVGRYDYNDIVEKLNAVLDNNQDCCFDLTGGKELLLVAMGAVSATRNVPMVQFNVKTGEMIRVKNCDNVAEPDRVNMSVKESIVLNGGAIVHNDENDFQWKLTPDFKKDIMTVWEICRENCKAWNRQANSLQNLERLGAVQGNCVYGHMNKLKDSRMDTSFNEDIINKLVSSGLIKDFSLKNNVVSFNYKNEQVRRCISKAGNILELYTYMQAHKIAEEDKEFYRDIDIGVPVDWDGVTEHSGKDTRNEIDVILMRGTVPVFISCKNGGVYKESLYEIDTVAARYGGKYTKKILLCTYVNSDEDSREYLLLRARDMKITVIEGVDRMTEEEFRDTLKSCTK